MGSNGSRIRYVATFLSLSLVLLACSGSDGDGQAATTASGGSNTTTESGQEGSTDTFAPEPDSFDDKLLTCPVATF